jgi:oligopeptide/dipeptide ABC transporter ATP-binding protein
VSPLLQVRDLEVAVRTPAGERRIVVGVTFSIDAGASLGLVGESGSGKSMTARSLMRLLPSTFRSTGEISFDGTSVPEMNRQQLQRFRSSDVGMIFQDPKAHTNPVRTIGDFLAEGSGTRHREAGKAASAAALELLNELGISDASRRLRQYPHELSGGMLQRVMIAGALLRGPRLLIADEPTTALDVTTQSAIMAKLGELRSERDLSLLFITHDLELAAATCDSIAVMYAGRIVEQAPARALEANPRHPYTAALLRSRPSLERRLPRLEAIPGRPISAHEANTGCAFAPRCPLAVERCAVERPLQRQLGESWVACHRAEELTSAGLPLEQVKQS